MAEVLRADDGHPRLPCRFGEPLVEDIGGRGEISGDCAFLRGGLHDVAMAEDVDGGLPSGTGNASCPLLWTSSQVLRGQEQLAFFMGR